MKITIIGPADPTGKREGGVETYINNLAITLSKRNINVTVVGVSFGGVPSDLPFRHISIAKGQRISGIKFLVKLMLHIPFLKISDCIIHTQRADMLFPFIFLHPEATKVCTIHGNASREIRSKKGELFGKIYDYVEKFVLKYIDRIIFVDAGAKKYYLKKYPWLCSKVEVIPIGVNLGKFKFLNKLEARKKHGFKEGDKIVLYVGRMVKDKNLVVLIKSFKIVENQLKNVKLVLVGDGMEKSNLKMLVTKLGVNNVLFLGHLDHDKIPEMMNCADVLALCSLYEGSPTIVKEALACGIPVVSTDVGDVKEAVINDKTGYLVNNNSNDIAKGIINAINNGENFKENCIKIAQRYDWNKIAERTLAVYQSLSKKT